MVPNVGILEIAIVLIIALVVFGPRKLPDLGRSLGKGLREFREGVSSIGGDAEEDDSDTEALPEAALPAAEEVDVEEVDVEEIPEPDEDSVPSARD